MAFGFLKKIAAVITGKSSAKKEDSAGGAKKRRRGGRGKGGNAQNQQQKGGQQQKGQQKGQQPKGGQQQKKQGAPQQQQKGQQKGQQPRGERREDRRGPRRGDRGRRGPVHVDTAANEMRPGGEISPEELAARKAAHAAWSLESFQVEPIEGKKRFHDFDLPSEVMHGIADLGFKYCTEIQALSLEQALAGKNIAGKAQT